MISRWRKSKRFKIAAYLTGMLQFAFPPFAVAAQNNGPQIVIDGRTNTNLVINQHVTDVYTNTVLGSTGLNSFSIFNVFEGNEVNLYVPDGADALMNMVHDQQSVIDGYLNAYKDGKIGGDIYFLNPFGVVVGETGVMNVGRLSLQAPTQDFMRNMFSANGMINAPQVTKVLDNDMTLSSTGLIAVRGEVNATSGAVLSGGDIEVSGSVETGAAAVVRIDNLVNLSGAMIDMDDVTPMVDLAAVNDIAITGRIGADGAAGQQAGDIDIAAGGNIAVGAGADISSDGQGLNSDGGTVILMADNLSTLSAGAVISADGGTSGDGGFVEFSARKTVELAGGQLSASAIDGAQGAILIDPEDIVISADLLRDSANSNGGNSGGGTTWNAGALTLQADDSITINDNVTVSSRHVANPSNVSSHVSGASTGDSGNIIFEADEITIGEDALVTAKADGSYDAGNITLDGKNLAAQSGAEIDASNSGSGDAGTILFDADDRDNASIIISGATLRGGDITLDADAVFTPGGVYSNPTANANAEIKLSSSAELIASQNITLNADATQNKAGYTSGVLVQFDARRADAQIELNDVDLTATDNITIGSASTIQTDMTPTGWGQMGTLLPLNVAVAVTYSTSDIVIDGASDITAGEALAVTSDAVTQSTVTSQSNSVGAALVAAISVTENRSTILVDENASLSGADGVTVKTKGKSQITALADASAGSVANLSGAIAIGVGITRDNTSTIIRDNASLTSSSGNVDILADSQVQTVFGARAGNDDNFTATAQSKFDAGIDDTPVLNQDFMGFNIGNFLKSGMSDQLNQVTSNMGNGGGSSLQLSGALTFSDIKNDTQALVTVLNPSTSTIAPSISAANGAIALKARSILQTQSMASGRSDNGSVGGSAGIGIQLVENRLTAKVNGSDNAAVNLTSDDLTVAALTQAYEDNISDLNKYSVFASSGVGNDGDSDEVGIAGAIAIQISNINDVVAEIGDNVTVAVDDNVTVTASNNTEIKVKADGSKGAQAASDHFFAVLDNSTPTDQVVKTNSTSGKLGIGASFAFAITENDVTAKIDGGAVFTGTDNISVIANQLSTTESEARSSGNGGIALVPVAAISVARNNALALIDSGSTTLSIADKATISSTQDVRTTSVGNGAAATGGDASIQVAVGLSAGISVGFDSNIAKLNRDLTVPGGLEIAALTSHDIQSGAQSSAEKVDPELIEDADEPEESEENTADNATNNSTMDTVDSLLGTTNGQSGKVVNADAIKGKLNTNFADASGGGTGIGGPSDSDEGSAVAIAGAFGVTYAESEAVAEIASDITVNAGSDNVSISSLKNTDMTSTGDASTSGSDYNIGGGVGLNIASSENTAVIRSGASITAAGVSVNAGMRSQIAADNSTDNTNVIAASATSGSGTGEVAIAGAVALNVVLENDTNAKIEDNATLTLANGDLIVEATSTTSYDAASKATVGKEAGLFAGIDAALSGLQDISVWTSHLSKQFTNLTTSAINKAYSEGSLFEDPSEGGGDSDDQGGGGDEGGFGLGAGISINAIVSEDTTAIIQDNVSFAGTGRVASARVEATSTTDMNTDAFAGAKPGAGNDPAAKTSLDAAVSVGVLLKDVDAYFGSQSTVLANGDVDVISTANTDSKSTAKGEVSASSTAVGASVAVSVVLETNEAEFNTNLTSYNGGGLTVQADSDSTDIVLADATAAGTALDKYTNKLGVSKSDLLGSSSAGSSNNDTPTSMSALNGDFSDGDSASYDLSGSDTATGENSGGEAQQSGSINIAASVGVNWADHKASAKIGGNVTIATDGDVLVEATNDANYRTRGSGMSVFSDKSIGVGVGLLKTGQKTQAQIGENVTMSTSGDDVNVRAVSSENQGTDPDNSSINFGGYASAEGIAGAGGGEIGVAGSLALTFSYDSQFAKIGKGTVINSSQNVGVTSTATNKIVSRAWAMALASDATCKDPGNCNSSSGDKTAVGASLAINIVIDNNSAEIEENVDLSGTTDNVTVAARDLSPLNAEFLLDPEDNSTTTEDYLQANYTATLQNSSYYAEAIAGGAAQGGNAGTGALAVTVSVGKTEAIVGEGVQIGGDNFAVIAYNESDARNVLGAIALAEKKAIGASISGIYLREDVRAIVAENTDGDSADNVTVNISGDMSVTATADQETLTLMAAGGVSANELALAGAFGFNVMDTDVESRIRQNADIRSTGGSVGVNATSLTDIRNFAIAVSGSGGSDSAGGSLALNLFLTDKKAIIGDSASNDNRISITAADAVNVGVTAKQEILNGVISAAVSTSSNAISGALSANIVKGDSYALVQKGADINQDTTVASTTQSVAVTAQDNTTITDLTGTLAASSSTSIGVALAGNVFWKDVKAGINSRVTADDNVMVTAETAQDLTATTVGIAGSTGGFSGAGSVAVGLVKSTTYADIGSDAVIETDGSVGVHAGDDTDIFMLEPAASFSAGGSALAGAVGAAVFIGTTKARILDNATISANGNESMVVEIDSTYTSSPLLDGIFGGGDNETRDALGDFNDNFTFDNIKDLFLTETRNTETRRGVAVSAVSDQDVISIAASGAVSSDNAIAISLSAGVGVNNTEASIASGVTINNDISAAHDDQDVIVRALSDTYWVDLSAALGVGTGTAGVGVGADVVVQVKNTDAFIAQNAVVKANRNVVVEADARDKIINSAATIGVGSTAGVAGTASVGVIVNDTEARIDGDVQAEDNVTVDADGTSELIQIAGAVGGGGTAGIGASFGVAVVKGETRALISNTAQVDGKGTTSVTADSTENSVAAVLAGGIGGTVGVSVSAGIKVHDSTTKATIQGQVNQRFDNSTYTNQDVAVRATNSVTTIDVIGGIGGGGTVGVGVSLNALVVHNKAQASIEGAVRAERDISVVADSAKSTKNFTLAGAAGGTVSVAGNVAVLLVGAQADEETDQQMTGSGDSNLADEADSRNNSLIVSDIINDNESDGDYSRTGTAFSDVATEIDAKQAQTNIGTKFNNYDNTTSLNQTKAYITSSAVVEAGRDLTVEAEDTTETIFTAGALGGAGVVGVGVTVGVLLVNNTAQAYVGDGATIDAGRKTLIRARTSEDVGSGALSAGGAGITSVQGVVMAQVTKSKTHAFIGDNASVNQNDNSSANQVVAVLAESDTDLVSVSGSGGGALVGVGITGDAVVLEKETKAYIDDNARVSSGGDITVDADAEADIIQVALSINGGLVGVTGAAGVVIAKNKTQAQIGNNAVIYANDSIRLEAKDDTEIDAIVLAGAGGAVGVSGAFGTYVFKSTTEATIGNDSDITANAQGGGMTVASGSVDNSSTSITSKTTRDQDGNEQTDNFTVVDNAYDNETARGLSITAVTNEDVNFAPVGLGFGAVGVAGVVATTVANSTTRAKVGNNTTINDDLSGASANQDVRMLAQSNSQLNNISSGISAGAAAVSLDIDTQIFTKTVETIIGDNVTIKANQNIDIAAKSRDRIYQTLVSAAIGGSGTGGIVGVSVVNNDVAATIGEDAIVRAGDNMTLESDQDLNVVQTAGNITGGGSGMGSSLGVLVVKGSSTARIGENANIAVRDQLLVSARTDTDINQNIIGFGGAAGVALTGSLGINILKSRTTAEIDDNAQINQIASYNDNSDQSVTVRAIDDIVTQGAAGAAAVGGTAGVGIGVVATVVRGTLKSRIGDNVVLNANDNVTVTADATKNVSNQGIAAAAGGIAGAAGSIALTLIGGSMSDNASQNLENDNGDLVTQAAADASEDRGNYDNDSAKANTAAYTEADDNDTIALVSAQTAGIANDVKGADSHSTLAEIGSGAQITAGGALTVDAEETLKLSQIAGGAAIGAVGLGGFVAVADYAGSVTARIGDNSQIDNVTSLSVGARVNSGTNKTLDLPDGSTLTVKAVNSTVIGASVGLVGLTASIANVNLVENASAEIGDNVTITAGADTGALSVTSERDVDAEVNVIGLAAGIAAAGVSYVGLNTSGNADTLIGANTSFATNTNRFGDATITARNTSTQKARAVSAGLGYYGAIVGAVVNVDDQGRSQVSVGNDSVLYANGDVAISATDEARNDGEAVGVAISAGVGLSIISSNVDVDRDAYTDFGDNIVIVGEEVAIGSTIGEAGQRMAKSDVIGAGGGLLVGATGSESIITNEANTRVSFGDNATVKTNRYSGGAEVDGDNLTITSTNLASTYNESNAIAIGAVAIGAHVTRSTQRGNSEITSGAQLTLSSTEDLTLTAKSDRDTHSESVAGAGGVIAATGGEAIVNHVSNARVVIGDGTNSLTAADIDASGALNITARNDDRYDGSIDASAVAAAGVTGAKLRATGSATSRVQIGDYADIDAGNLAISSLNNLAKTGLDRNFYFAGGGAISVTVGDSRTSQSQYSDVTFGDFSDVYVRGTQSNNGAVDIQAVNSVTAYDTAEINTGALVGVPVSNTAITTNATSRVLFEDNASIFTRFGDMNITANTSSDILSKARTSVWGGAGIGATGLSSSKLTSNNSVILDEGSEVTANGFLTVSAGKSNSTLNVKADTKIYNNTIIAAIFGEKADATLNQNNLIDIKSDAKLQSARHMNLRASKGVQNVSGDGFKQWLQYVGIAVVPLSGDFGRSNKNGNSRINVDGLVRTGVHAEQHIGFGTDMTTWIQDPDNSSNTIKQLLVQTNGLWFRDNGTQLSVAVGEYSDDRDVSFASSDFIEWTVEQNRSFANDIDDEILALQSALAAASDNESYSVLAAQRQGLVDNKTYIQSLGATQTQQDAIDNLTAQRNAKQTLKSQKESQRTQAQNDNNTALVNSLTSEINTLSSDIASLNVTIDNMTNGDASGDISTNADLIASLDAQIADVDAQIAALGDNSTSTNINAEIAFLQAKKDALNTGQVDVYVVDDIFAATGNVYFEADTVSGATGGKILSENEVNVSVRNDSGNPLEVGNIEIANDAGGSIYFNKQEINSTADIASINRDKSAATNMTLEHDPDNFVTNISIKSNFDPNVTAYNPNSLDIKAPEIIVDGTIENRPGTVTISNKFGGIHQNGNINADTVRITAGGSLFVASKDPGIYNVGPHPSTANGFNSYAADRLDGIGSSTDNDLGGCGGNGMPWDPNNSDPCSVSTATQASEDSYSIVGGRVFIVANTVNLNGLIQSGIADKEIVIPASHSVFSQTTGTHDLVIDNITYNNQDGLAREGVDGVYAYYNADDDIIELSGFAAQGGDVTVVGKLISTGRGQINVLDGYGTFDITNNSSKTIKLTGIDTGEVEGKVTLVDNAKDNGFGEPVVTQYTRIGNNINVYTNDGVNTTAATEELSGKHNTAGRTTSYDPQSNLRYFWIDGESVNITRTYVTPQSNWKTFTINHSYTSSFRPPSNITPGQQMPASDLPMADYAAEVASSNDYNFRWAYERDGYDINSAVENYHCKGIPFFVEKCWWDVRTIEKDNGTMFYYQDVRADRPVDIKFIGSDTSSLTVVSNGGINIAGDIRNNGGDTTLRSTGGSIEISNSDAVIDIADLTIEANGAIGTAANPFTAIFQDNASINSTSGAGAHFKSDADDLLFTNLENTAGNVSLYAGQNIVIDTGTNALQGDNITLTAQYGSISNQGGGTLRLNTLSGGIVNAYSRDGDIDITELSGDLYIESIDTIGNVVITTQSGSLLDANAAQTNDEETQSALLSLWDDLGLRGDNATTKLNDQVASYNDSQENLYEDYFELRNVSIDDNGTASADAYDADYEYEISTEERNNLRRNRYSEEMNELYNTYWELRGVTQDADGNYIAEAYDPNFVYTATDEEREALDNDAAAISDYEAEKIADYQQGHAKFGSGNYVAGYEYVVAQSELDNLSSSYAATAIASFEAEREARYQAGYDAFGNVAYDDNFTSNLTASDIASQTNGYLWSDEHLEAPLPGQAFKEVTDSTAFIETANITGDNITLNITGGNIGTFTDTATFALADVEAGTLDNDSKVKLMAAEADDIELNETTNMVTLTQREDIDINTLNAGSVVNVNVPDGYAFLGGETSVNINTVAADGEIRFKINGDIFNVRSDTNAAVTSDNLVLEAATGTIGTSSNPLYLDVRDGYKMTARARNGIYITEKTGDIRVAQIYTPDTLNLISPDRILDAEDDLITDMKASIINLTAPNGIGLAPVPSDNLTVEAQKALDVQSLRNDNSTFTVTSSDGGAYFYIEGEKFVRLTDITVDDDLRVGMGTNGELYATGTFATGDDDVSVWGGTGGAILDMTGGLDTGGDRLAVVSGGDATIDGALNTGGGNISIAALDEIDVASTSAFTTDNGTLSFAARDIAINGTHNTGTGTVSATADDNITFGGSLTTAGANVLFSNDVIGVDQVIRLLANSAIETNDGDVTFLSSQGIRTGLMIEDTARIDAGAGHFDFTFTGEAALTGLTTSNASDDAVVVSARTIQDSGDTRDDITINSNGDLTLRAAKYINLNKIDYNGSENLNLALSSSTLGASAAGIVLDIDAEAGIDISQLYSRNASIVAGVSSDLAIEDGRIRDELFLNIGDFDARVGRLRDNSLVPASWVEDSEDAGFFISASAEDGLREEDYRCTGNPSYIGNNASVLNFNFFFDSPNVDCSGLLTFYRLPYVLVNPQQSSEQELGNIISSTMRNSVVTIDPVSTSRLSQSIVASNRAVQIASGQAVEVTIDDVAASFGITDEALAAEFAETFTVREPTALGVVQINPDNLIQLGLPLLQDIPLDDELIEPEGEPAEGDDEPTDTVEEGAEEQPLAANDNGEEAIGPLSFLDN